MNFITLSYFRGEDPAQCFEDERQALGVEESEMFCCEAHEREQRHSMLDANAVAFGQAAHLGVLFAKWGA